MSFLDDLYYAKIMKMSHYKNIMVMLNVFCALFNFFPKP